MRYKSIETRTCKILGYLSKVDNNQRYFSLYLFLRDTFITILRNQTMTALHTYLGPQKRNTCIRPLLDRYSHF